MVDEEARVFPGFGVAVQTFESAKDKKPVKLEEFKAPLD